MGDFLSCEKCKIETETDANLKNVTHHVSARSTQVKQ